MKFIAAILLLHIAVAQEDAERINYTDSAWRFIRKNGMLQNADLYTTKAYAVPKTHLLLNYHFKLSGGLTKDKYIIVLITKKTENRMKQLGSGTIYILLDLETGSILDYYRDR